MYAHDGLRSSAMNNYMHGCSQSLHVLCQVSIQLLCRDLMHHNLEDNKYETQAYSEYNILEGISAKINVCTIN